MISTYPVRAYSEKEITFIDGVPSGSDSTYSDKFVNLDLGKMVLLYGQSNDYLSKIKAQAEAGTPYQYTDTQFLTTPVPATAVLERSVAGSPRVKYKETYECNYLMPPSFNAPIPRQSLTDAESADVATAKGRAMLKMYNKLKSQEQSIQALVILGEAQHTLHSIRHPADALVGALKLFKEKRNLIARNNYNQIRRARKAFERNEKKLLALEEKIRTSNKTLISNLWLEFHLAVIPLISDITAIAKAYHSELVKPAHQKSLKTIETLSWTREATYPSRDMNFASFTSTITTSVDVKFTVYAGLRIERRASNRTAVENLIDKGAINLSTPSAAMTFLRSLAPAAWELTYYSFVADYVSNIGDVINALNTSTANVSYTNVGEEVVFTTNIETSLSGVNPVFPSVILSETMGSLQYKQLDYHRTVEALTIPSVSFNKPSKWQQYFTVASLALVGTSKPKSLRL